MGSPVISMPQPWSWMQATTASTFGQGARRSAVKCSAIFLATVVEQLTVTKMPITLRVATRPSSRTMPWKVARNSCGRSSTGR
jgi:hypothetical protein